MTYQNDWKKLLVAEIRAGKQLQDATWTRENGTWATYYDSTEAYIACSIVWNGHLYFASGWGAHKLYQDGVLVYTGATGFYSFAIHGSKLFAGGSGGNVYVTSDGTTWAATAGNLTGIIDSIQSMLSDGGLLYATGDPHGKVYTSADDGATWVASLALSLTAEGHGLIEFSIDGYIYAGLGKYIYQWDGVTWAVVYTGAVGQIFRSSFEWDGVLCFGGSDGKIYYTSNGFDWVSVATGGSGNVYALIEYESELLAAVTGAVYRASDILTWSLFYTSAEAAVYSIAILSEVLYLTTGTAGKVMSYTLIATWQCAWNYGEVVELKVDGIALTKETDLATCQTTADSYFHDFFAGILHVHLTGGYSPGEFVSPSYTYNVVAYFWKCFSNRQEEGSQAVVFIPTGCTYPVFYDPVLRAESLSQLTATVADHYESAMETSCGGIIIVNAEGWWYAAVDNFYWNNADIRAKIGEIGDIYSALETIFIGKIRTPSVSDDSVIFEMVDNRQGRLQSIPTTHYDTTRFPNLDVNSVGVPIPVLFGEKKNISPVQIDTTAHTFKISETHFSSVFELQAIDAVYFRGAILSIVTHYTVDLHNGEFSLTFDPADGLITCDAKGIKDGFNMATGAATGAYSEKVADHLFFVLNILNGIPVADIDLTSFSDLQAARTQAVAWLLDTDTPTIDFNRLLQQTSIYHFLPLNNGTFAARYYRKTVPTGTLELRNHDHAGYKKTRPSDGIFRDIILKYDKDPTTGVWKTLIHTESVVEQNYNTKETYSIDTALREDSEAAAILAFYVALLKIPPTKIETSISMIGSAVLPTDKIINNRDIVADGKPVVISTDEIYVILQTRKDFANARVGVTAQLDTQLAIYTIHSDSPHQDVTHIDHSDTLHDDGVHSDHDDNIPHTDAAHQDAAHSDEAHADEAHSDYEDVPYSDGPHTDSHSDEAHSDSPHEDVPYADVAHADTAHGDAPHEDYDHANHTDVIHYDLHTDIAHVDSEI